MWLKVIGCVSSPCAHLKIMKQSWTPKFLDVNSLKDVDEKTLRNAQNSAKDEFGVTHYTIKHFMNPNLMCPDPRINFSY
jgi:hypothetical protein